MSNREALEARWPSMRDTQSPPETATVTVDETAPADDTEGDLIPSSPPAGLVTALEPPAAPVIAAVDPHTALKSAEHALNLARVEARQCRDRTLAARTAFGKALQNWNQAQPVWTSGTASPRVHRYVKC